MLILFICYALIGIFAMLILLTFCILDHNLSKPKEHHRFDAGCYIKGKDDKWIEFKDYKNI